MADDYRELEAGLRAQCKYGLFDTPLPIVPGDKAADAIRALRERAERAEAACEKVALDAECGIEQYHKTGPYYTSRKTGEEYYPASYVIEKLEELQTAARAGMNAKNPLPAD